MTEHAPGAGRGGPVAKTERGPVADGVGPRGGTDQGSGGVVFSRVSASYGEPRSRDRVVEDVTFSVERGQFVSLIGPSGCGKSTLLRIAAGLRDADEGEVDVLGTTARIACGHKLVGLVPQSPALLPWRSVLDNVRLPLEVNRRATAPGRVLPDAVEMLASFGLGDVLDRRPAELSGGMQQRVAIARAFVFDPELLLMDEPFSALDELTRELLRYELLRVWSARRTTVLFVTHSVAEAVALSDVVVVMSPAPGTVRASVPVTLERPRDAGVELTDAFRDIEAVVRGHLRAGPGARSSKGCP